MPYSNGYNKKIAAKVNDFNQQHVTHENVVADNDHHYDVVSPLESMALKHPEVAGGSGYAAATLQDLGFEPTMGATSGEGKPKRTRKKKPWARGCPQGGSCQPLARQWC